MMFSDSNPAILPPVKSDEFLPPISPWTTLGGLFLVSAVGAAFTLAAITKYHISVKAPATVRPAGELRIVQAATEGTITQIAVKENQTVNQGEAIAYIDASRLQTQKSQRQSNLQLNRRQLKQIDAQMKALETQMVSESNLMNSTITSAQADLIRNQRAYGEQQVTTRTEVKEAEADLELARVQMEQYQQLKNSGAIAQLQIREKEQAFKAAQAKLERARATLNPSSASVTIATEKIAQEKARGEATLATLNKQRDELIQRRIEIQNQLSHDQKELQQIESDLNKSMIKAPEAGTLLKLNLRNTGQVVRSGESIAQIAPRHAHLVIKAHVAAQDIGKVRLCKQENVDECEQGKVQLRISAYPYPDYGTLKGAVREIAPDAITSQSNDASASIPYYEVTIQPQKLYFLRSDHQYPIQPGMEATADIISQEETVLTFIFRRARLLTNL